MLIRVKWHLILSLIVLAGLFFRSYHQASDSRFRQQEEFDLLYSDLRTKILFPVNATEGGRNGTCQCSPCEVQHSELEVVESWDSSTVLRGAPTERFRGMYDIALTLDIKEFNRPR